MKDENISQCNRADVALKQINKYLVVRVIGL
jgi:hypothetical protein